MVLEREKKWETIYPLKGGLNREDGSREGKKVGNYLSVEGRLEKIYIFQILSYFNIILLLYLCSVWYVCVVGCLSLCRF
jgi:hypothetical protein